MLKPIKYLLLGGLLALSTAPTVSAEISLTEFEADYELFYGDLKAANAHLSFKKNGNNWRWLLTTKPTGLLAILTNKKPYSETTISLVDDSPRIHKLTIADEGKKDNKLEVASFDWNSQQVQMLRKGVTNTEALTGVVYDYLSVHTLSAKMLREKLQQFSADFYYKGRLVKLELKQLADATITIGADEINTVVFEQSLEGSRTKSIYYYDADRPLIPMKIKTMKPDRKSTSMIYQPPGS